VGGVDDRFLDGESGETAAAFECGGGGKCSLGGGGDGSNASREDDVGLNIGSVSVSCGDGGCDGGGGGRVNGAEGVMVFL